MFLRFNAEISGLELSGSIAQQAIRSAKIKLEENKLKVRAELDKFILPNGNFDGKKMQDEWFPEIQADVFLSHSHADLDLTLFIASVLEAYDLKVFIDSAVWGYANDLLRQIDNELCSNGKGTYSYELRNYSTAHVHMMLSVALSKMIDKSECLFFLNTPNSVSTRGLIKNKTESPWIYSEIAMSNLMRVKEPKRQQVRSFAEGGKVELTLESRIEQELNLVDFIRFNNSDLINWTEAISEGTHALDVLYKYIIKRDGKL